MSLCVYMWSNRFNCVAPKVQWSRSEKWDRIPGDCNVQIFQRKIQTGDMWDSLDSLDRISPDNRPLKIMNCPMVSWAEEQVLFFYLFIYFVFVFEWQAPHSGSWCQLQRGILYELTRDPLWKLLVPSESQVDAVCRGPKTPCFPSEPTAALELDSRGCQGTCFACGHSRLAFTWRPSR